MHSYSAQPRFFFPLEIIQLFKPRPPHSLLQTLNKISQKNSVQQHYYSRTTIKNKAKKKEHYNITVKRNIIIKKKEFKIRYHFDFTYKLDHFVVSPLINRCIIVKLYRRKIELKFWGKWMGFIESFTSWILFWKKIFFKVKLSIKTLRRYYNTKTNFFSYLD